jgi:hypothetical protein
MDHQLAGPWLILGGYAVAGVVLWLGGKLRGRGSTVCYGLAGIVLSETTLYWVSAGTDSNVPDILWFVFPLVVTALVAWRGYRLRTWTKRVGGAAQPTFGVFPRQGLAVGLAEQHRDPVETVEFEHHGYRLLGVQYGLGGRREEEGFESLRKTASLIDGTYSMVQLRTPVVPSLVIRPNTAAFEPERFTPLEDARITRNTVGALKPDAFLRAVDDIDRAFTVTSTDPEFARAVLTDEVIAMLTTDPWFRVREIACHEGSLWVTESGSLTRERMFVNSRHLARLAAIIPWEDEEFRRFAAETDTSETSWLGRGRGGIRTAINRRREAAGRQTLSAISLTVRTVVVVALLVPGLSLLSTRWRH